MKTVLIAVGSRGDVLPQIHLANHLTRTGHEAVLVTVDDQLPLATEHGVDAISAAPGFSFVGSGRDLDESRRTRFENPLGTLTELQAIMRNVAGPMGDLLDDLVDDGDTVLHGVLGAGAATALGATRPCRIVQVTFAATIPTAYGPSYISAPFPSRQSRVNLLASRMAHRFFVGLGRPPGEVIAGKHGQQLTGRDIHHAVMRNPTLVATSPLLAPPAPDWGELVTVTGAWQPPEWPTTTTQDAPGALQEFLAAGPAPVYIGFGSAVARDPVADLSVFARSAARAGVRLVMRRSAWSTGAAPRFGDDVLVIDTVPHDWLFPQMAAIVHHGGAGTTVAALRAGVPSSIVWHNVDQPAHARRCAALGVGPRGFAKSKLTDDRLARLLIDLTQDLHGYREAAHVASQQLSLETGLRTAAATLRRWGAL